MTPRKAAAQKAATELAAEAKKDTPKQWYEIWK